jgi:hypothetical protein
MVPDLAASEAQRDEAYWHFWISAGKPDSLMPAFGEKDGGPLTDEQMKHLAEYLTARFETVAATAEASTPEPGPGSGPGPGE